MASPWRIRRATSLALAVLIIAMAATGVQAGHAAISSNLSVTFSGIVFTAARNDTKAGIEGLKTPSSVN